MGDNVVTIERRYEYYGREGIKWTKWFRFKDYETEQAAKDALKLLKKEKEAVKKLHGEYRIREQETT